MSKLEIIFNNIFNLICLKVASASNTEITEKTFYVSSYSWSLTSDVFFAWSTSQLGSGTSHLHVEIDLDNIM